MEKLTVSTIIALSLGILLFVIESIYSVFEYGWSLNTDDIIIKYIFWTQIAIIFAVSTLISKENKWVISKTL